MTEIQSLGKRDRVRKFTNFVALASLYLISLIAIAPLFFIFSYVIYRGAANFNFEFFTQMPKPIGEVGGGMSNALVGSLVLIGIASLVGIPWGIAAGIFLAEYKQ